MKVIGFFWLIYRALWEDFGKLENHQEWLKVEGEEELIGIKEADDLM